MITLHHGDCREIAPGLGPVDAVVTDPPYHLLPTVQRFGKSVMHETRATRPNQYGRLARGFMGQEWDGGDIATRPETWAAIGEALRPGGFLVAFGGTRTYHRMACAIEDAGFVIQDCLMWLYATGFPKRRDMLKPAFEPIVLAYKPGGKRTLQVDECRIPGTPESTRFDPARHNHEGWRFDATGAECAERASPLGRWPANICHDGSDEVVGLFPETGPSPKGMITQGGDHFSIGSERKTRGQKFQGHGDSGSSARFFMSAKAGSQDRWGSRHPTVKPVELMKWLVKLVTPIGGTCLDPFAGSGTTAVAALATGRNAILIEREDAYCEDIKARLAHYDGGGTHSVQAKNRNRTPFVREGDLFAAPSPPRRAIGELGSGWDEVFVPPLSPEEDAADSLASYNAAMVAVGEAVKAGAPVPEFMRSKKEAAD